MAEPTIEQLEEKIAAERAKSAPVADLKAAEEEIRRADLAAELDSLQPKPKSKADLEAEGAPTPPPAPPTPVRPADNGAENKDNA